jgi:hypothetical protein
VTVLRREEWECLFGSAYERRHSSSELPPARTERFDSPAVSSVEVESQGLAVLAVFVSTVLGLFAARLLGKVILIERVVFGGGLRAAFC